MIREGDQNRSLFFSTNFLFKNFTEYFKNVIIWKKGEKMSKKYLDKDVLEAAQERLELMFNNFEHIYFSVSRRKRQLCYGSISQYSRKKNE